MNSPDATPALPTAVAPPAEPSQRELARLLLLFGTLYFIQGVVEPTANLPYQPLQTQLSRWGYSTGEVGRFFAIIGIAWSIKPLFGLVSDFFPIAGRRRRPYLLLSATLATAAFALLAATWGRPALAGSLAGWFDWQANLKSHPQSLGDAGWLLLIAGIGIAMSDVVIDALAVEEGQPRGIT